MILDLEIRNFFEEKFCTKMTTFEPVQSIYSLHRTKFIPLLRIRQILTNFNKVLKKL